jgi:hypothetical protein
MELLLEAPADAGLGLGVGGGGGGDLSGRGGGVEVEELLRLEGELGVARLVVDLHGLDVRRGGAAERARQLRVASLVLRQPVRQTRLAAAPVGRCGVDLRGDLLGRVLLWLRLARHRRHPRLAVAAAGPFLTTLIAFEFFFAVMSAAAAVRPIIGRPRFLPAAVVGPPPPLDLRLVVAMMWARRPNPGFVYSRIWLVYVIEIRSTSN